MSTVRRCFVYLFFFTAASYSSVAYAGAASHAGAAQPFRSAAQARPLMQPAERQLEQSVSETLSKAGWRDEIMGAGGDLVFVKTLQLTEKWDTTSSAWKNKTR